MQALVEQAWNGDGIVPWAAQISCSSGRDGIGTAGGCAACREMVNGRWAMVDGSR